MPRKRKPNPVDAAREKAEHRAKLRAQLQSWFTDPDTWAGVFENQDLGSQYIGERCCFPFKLSDGSFDAAVIGTTSAPNGKTIGLGWRYILVAKCQGPDEVLQHLLREDVPGKEG